MYSRLEPRSTKLENNVAAKQGATAEAEGSLPNARVKNPLDKLVGLFAEKIESGMLPTQTCRTLLKGRTQDGSVCVSPMFGFSQTSTLATIDWAPYHPVSC